MAAPLDPPLGVPIRELKSANTADGYYWLLVSRESDFWQNNAPIKRGTKYSDIRGANQRVIDAHSAGLWFCEEILPLRSSEVGGMPGERFVIWVFSTDWAAQSSTNAGVTYAEDSTSHPIFARDYLVRRDLWQTTPTIATGSALTALVGATITAGGTGYTTATGTVGNATCVFVCSGGALISAIVTSEGSGIASGGAITITGDGAGATATAVIQPATAVLVRQEKSELPADSNLSKEFVLVRRIYETLPGPILSELLAWDEEAWVQMARFTQRVLTSTIDTHLPAIGSSYSTASIVAHNAIASLTIADPGSDYIALPTGAIEASPGGGTQATMTVDKLKVVSGTLYSGGLGYAIGDVLTVAGGTFTTAATLTVAVVGLSSLAQNAIGITYSPGDLITLFGGVPSGGAATLSVLTTKVNTPSPLAPGTGMVPGATLTLVGGTQTTNATVTISTTLVVSATVAAGGAGGTPGTQIVTGTTGTGTPFQASVTVSGGGAVTAVLSITVSGSYTVNPTSITNEPVTGAGLAGAQLSVIMGVQSVAVLNRGVFTANPALTSATSVTMTSTGGGNNATFTVTIGVGTFSILSPGGYSTTSTTFTQDSVLPVGGTGATFQTAVFSIQQLSVSNGGAYTVIASSPNSVTGGSGSGMSVNLSYGIGAVTLTNGGTLYYNNSPLVTLSAGNAQIISVSDTPSVITGRTGYVISRGSRPLSSLVSEITWTISPLPPTQVIYYNDYVNIPRLLYDLRISVICNGSSGFKVLTRAISDGGNSQVRKHRLTISYTLTGTVIESFSSWVTQDINYNGVFLGFNFQGVLNNRLQFNQTAENDGCTWQEQYDFPASVPSASGFAGHWYVLESTPRGWHGLMFRRVKKEVLP